MVQRLNEVKFQWYASSSNIRNIKGPFNKKSKKETPLRGILNKNMVITKHVRRSLNKVVITRVEEQK